MVGKRHRTDDLRLAFGRTSTAQSRRPWSGHTYRDDDEEASVRSPVPSRPVTETDDERSENQAKATHLSFRDAAHLVMAESRRNGLKNQIIAGVEGFSLEKYRKSDEEIKEMKSKKLRKFYEAQNERLDDWIEIDALVHAVSDDVLDSMNPDADHDGYAERSGPLQVTRGVVDSFLPEEHRRKRAENEKKARWAININVIANVLMLAGKLISLKFSPSLSLIASTADSALDLFCTIIVYSTNRLVAWRLDSLRRKYPVGRRRLEPLGILVFSVIMVVSFLQILQESVEKLLPGGDREIAALPPVAIGAMAANAVVKGVIGLLCRPIKTTQVQALVQDCKTDVYFNLASLLFPLIGAQAGVWWLDPLGAALLALYVVYDWADTCMQNANRLTGCGVTDEQLQRKLMFLAWRFSPLVLGFKSLTAYHAGDGVWVELDILMPEHATSLARAHDTAETLQYCYESLPEVDRAFVTVDYSTLGPTGHAEEERNPPNNSSSSSSSSNRGHSNSGENN